LAQGAVRIAGLVGRRAHDGRDDGELHGIGCDAELVGQTPRCRPRRAWLRGPARRAGVLERLYPPERHEGARDAGHRARHGAALHARRHRSRRPGRDGGRAPRARRRARDHRWERRRSERGRLRSDRRPRRSRRALRRVAPRRRRVFDAPRERVFDVFTQPEHVEKWWGPKGVSNTVAEFEARPGGKIFIAERALDGATIYIAGVVREIERPSRVLYAIHFADAERRRLAPPAHRGLGDTWDDEIVTLVTFST